MPIPVFKPSIKRRDMQSVLSCLASDVAGPGMAALDLAKTVSDDWKFAGGLACGSIPEQSSWPWQPPVLKKGTL